MKKRFLRNGTKLSLALTAVLVLFWTSAGSATIALFDWAYYVDGTTYENSLGDSMPTSGSLDGQGLGSLSWTANNIGNHTFIAFFDHEIDEATNTFFNEYGSVNGIPSAGQSWEIDEPGYVFGDIYDNVLNGALDNTNSVPMGNENDVSWAMGWDFSLNANEQALITILLTDNLPSSGFYLSQTDPDSNKTIYYSSNLTIEPAQKPVPEPTTTLLLGTGLAGLALVRRKKFFKK